MKCKIHLYIYLIFSLMLLICPAYAEQPDLGSASYILIDQKSGQVLYEKNADIKLYPASTTKIMTAIVALENWDLDKPMTANLEDVYAIGPGGMNIGIMAGEEIVFEDLLNALLVRSANETAYIIARNISSDYSSFALLMNKKAKELGAINTNFVNPCGMDTEPSELNHLSTARDLSTIARYAMNIPKFREIAGKKSYTMPPTNKHNKEVFLATTNKLLSYGKYNKSDYYTKITGIKTGYTDRAGHNLVASAQNADGMELISVVLNVKNGSADTIYDYSKELLEYGFKNYSLKKIVSKDYEYASMPVLNAKKGDDTIKLVAKNDLISVLPNEENPSVVQKKYFIPNTFTAPIEKNALLGYVEYWYNDTLLGKVNVVAKNHVPKETKPIFLDYIVKIAMIFYVFIVMRMTIKNISK